MSQSPHQNHFLDRSTLIALCLLFLSWILWDNYMKKKYPEAFEKREALRQEQPWQEAQPKEKTFSQKNQVLKLETQKAIPLEAQPEEKFWFRGEKLELLFSSRGLGLEKILIKNYQNREGKMVEFESLDKPLFASSLDTIPFIPFQIEEKPDAQTENKLKASFSSSDLEITKEISIDESKWLLKVQTHIKPKQEKELPDLRVFFSHPIPESKAKGFFSFLSIYGMDMLKGFLFYKGKEQKSFYEIKSCEAGQSSCHHYPQTEIVALGGKYFGKAFINKAELLPELSLTENKGLAQAEINYNFLHNKKQKVNYQIFIGPKSLKNFEDLGGNIRLWLDFGFFSWLARPLLMILTLLFSFLGNWGLAIIVLTLIMRLLLLPINIKSYQSMKIMQQIQPEIKEIRETHKKDPKKMNEEVMALMKKHKANPLGGCLPMFLQLPVFFALYRVLGESIELYQSPFFLWIQDLSLKDPYYVFPVLAGLVLFVQQLITPMNLPKEQARLMKIIPLIFSVFMLNLPSGLTIYIFISGLFGLAQQSFFIRTKTA